MARPAPCAWGCPRDPRWPREEPGTDKASPALCRHGRCVGEPRAGERGRPTLCQYPGRRHGLSGGARPVGYFPRLGPGSPAGSGQSSGLGEGDKAQACEGRGPGPKAGLAGTQLALLMLLRRAPEAGGLPVPGCAAPRPAPPRTSPWARSPAPAAPGIPSRCISFKVPAARPTGASVCHLQGCHAADQPPRGAPRVAKGVSVARRVPSTTSLEDENAPSLLSAAPQHPTQGSTTEPSLRTGRQRRALMPQRPVCADPEGQFKGCKPSWS